MLNENRGNSPGALPERKIWASFSVLSDWLNLLCLVFALGTVVWSVEQAQWVRPSPSFITIFILAVLTGFILAKSRLPSLVAHLISIAAAIVVLFSQGILLVGGTDLLSRVTSFINAVQEWWFAQINAIPSSNTLHIALIFGFLTWIIGYFSTWPLLKKHNPWVAVLLGTVAIVLNLNFETSDKYFYFVIFLAGALALIATANYTKRNSQLVKSNQSVSKWGTKLWAVAIMGLVIVAICLTWISPASGRERSS